MFPEIIHDDGEDSKELDPYSFVWGSAYSKDKRKSYSPNSISRKLYPLTIPTSPLRPISSPKDPKGQTRRRKVSFDRKLRHFSRSRDSKDFVRAQTHDDVPICEDTILLVCMFLEKSDIRAFSATSLRFRAIAISYSLHINFILDHPFIPSVISPFTPLKVNDSSSLSSSLFFLPPSHSPMSLQSLSAFNLPPLISQNMRPPSSCASSSSTSSFLTPNDQTIIDPPSLHLLTSLLTETPTCMDAASITPSCFHQYELGGKSVIQFTGSIGLGDRCLRSKVPFPSVPPKKSKSSSPNLLPFSITPRPLAPLVSVVSEIVRAASFLTSRPPPPASSIRPFTSPIVVSADPTDKSNDVVDNNVDDPSTLKIDLSPRLWSYFEVTVFARDLTVEKSLSDPSSSTHEEIFINESASLIECIAIGLSTETFPLKNKMPGWDANSFGYHSDDGGIFRNNGDMVREFGPKWGEGDTVGCGIYYAEGGGRIFFTLNGRFLGYAFLNVALHEPLYPTVGIDSNKPIAVNFGHKPFVFDSSKLGIGRDEIMERLNLGSRCKQMKRIKRRRSRARAKTI
mmetsp:Transcript_17443/g.36045  ORF Transcript_17443/g.36045 Transcript_17443/m.36045 type:complete len:567 (-) Transcript_17443:28-1728(-)